MREIHYIDIDEEIISAVGRLRKSGQSENVFIFPKRALILQSIVNLRLLEREAKKLGKQIIVVSQDEAGRKLAEKAGLVVEEYQDQSLQEARAKETARFTVEHADGSIPLPEKSALTEARQHSSNIGSESFFSSGAIPATNGIISEKIPSPAPLVSITTPPRNHLPVAGLDSHKKLHVRDVTPGQLTALNSKRRSIPTRAFPETSFSQNLQSAFPQETTQRPAGKPQQGLSVMSPQAQRSSSRQSLEPDQSNGKGKLARFMEAKQAAMPYSLATPAGNSMIERKQQTFSQIPSHATSGQRHVTWAWLFLGSLVLVSGVGLGLFVLFPEAIVTLEPQTAEQIIRFQGAVVTDGNMGQNTFSGRVATLERSVQVSEEATGTATGDNVKARGKIKIYNDFSKDTQPLVATTRFETKDGKLFRLLEGVTVPGVTETGGKRERGMVEATVVADQAGAEYNINATTFTIPGFKGGPKYEKFTAESMQAFTGGGNDNTPSGQRVVSGDDLNRAKAKALEEVKRIALEEFGTSLKEGETVLIDSLLLTERPGATTPTLGAIQASFSYEARFEAKAFIINETSVRERIAKERVTTEGVTLTPREYDVRYTALLPKYDVGKIDMTVESTVIFQAAIDQEKIKSVLLGQDEAGMRTFLENHPEVERLQVEFHPQLLVSTIPKQASRVTVEIVPSGEEED